MFKSERPGPINSPSLVKKPLKAISLEDGEIEDSFNKSINFGNSMQKDSIVMNNENDDNESGDISSSEEEKNMQIIKQPKRRRKKSEEKKLKERKSRHKKRKSENVSDSNASLPFLKKKKSKRCYEEKKQSERRPSKMECLEEKPASPFVGDDSISDQFEEKIRKNLRKGGKQSQISNVECTSGALHCKSNILTSSSSDSDSCYSDLETHLKKGHKCPSSKASRNENDGHVISHSRMKRQKVRRFQDPIQCSTNGGNTKLPSINYMVISPSDQKPSNGQEKSQYPFEAPCHRCPGRVSDFKSVTDFNSNEQDQQHNRTLPQFLQRDPRRKFQFTGKSEHNLNQMWTQNYSNHLQRIDHYGKPRFNPFPTSPEKNVMRPFHSGPGALNSNLNCFHDLPIWRRGIYPFHPEGHCRLLMDLQQKLEANIKEQNWVEASRLLNLKMANDRQISPFVHPPYPPPMPSGLLNQGHMERPPICSIPMQKPAQIGDLLPPPVFMRPVHRQPMLMPHPPPMQRPMQPVLPPVIPPWMPPELIFQQQMKGIGHPSHLLNKVNTFKINPPSLERENDIKNETKGDSIQGVKPDENNGFKTKIESSTNSLTSLLDSTTKKKQAAIASMDPDSSNKIANTVNISYTTLDPRIARHLHTSSNLPPTPSKQKGQGEGPIKLILKRKINANDLRKEPLVIPFSTESNVKETRVDPRVEQSRLLRKEKRLFSASLPLFAKCVSSSRITKKLPLQNSPCSKSAGISCTEASKPSDPRKTRPNPKSGFDSPASKTAQPPAPVTKSPILSSSAFAFKPVALLNKSFPCGSRSIDLDFPFIQQESSKSAQSSPLKQSAGDLPKLPELTKTESLSFENIRFNQQIASATDAISSPPAAKKHLMKSSADVLKKNDDFDSNDVILKTGYFTEGNTQSLLGQNSSETGFQLPKLTPAPGYAVEVRSTVEKMAKGQNG